LVSEHKEIEIIENLTIKENQFEKKFLWFLLSLKEKKIILPKYLKIEISKMINTQKFFSSDAIYSMKNRELVLETKLENRLFSLIEVDKRAFIFYYQEKNISKQPKKKFWEASKKIPFKVKINLFYLFI
jgi:hypothetical protein